MRALIAAVFIFSVFIACKTTKSSEIIIYENENGLVEYYNPNKKTKPLIIIIPAVYNSVITAQQIENMAKKNRVAVVHFLSHTDKTRVQQIDGFTNRLNYYSTVLSTILDTEEELPTIVSEGINTTLTIQLGLSFKQPKLILVNAWYPTMQEIINVNCYANSYNGCDSLLNYLSFSDHSVVDQLVSAIRENGTDKQYGNYTLQVWKEFIQIDCDDLLINYKNEIQWIFTSNSGLLSKEENQQLKTSHGKRKNTQLVSLKEFHKNNILSN